MSTHEQRRAAVALAYRTGDDAPTVVAKGRGAIADNIIAKAREHGIYVHESPELVGMLMQVDMDRCIPPQLYTVVAELLVWIYRIEHGLARADRPALVQEARPT